MIKNIALQGTKQSASEQRLHIVFPFRRFTIHLIMGNLIASFLKPAKAEPNLRQLKIDTEAHQVAAGKYGIRSIPTLMLFKAGKEIARVSGAMNEMQLQQWVDQQLTGL